MKLNLGSGSTRFDGFLNVDDDPLVSPDYVINLDDVNIKLPFEDNSVEEIKAYHIFEHIGAGFIPLLKEIYRVCKNNALIDIKVPHHFHDIFYGDLTHVRPITVAAMSQLSKDYNKTMGTNSSGIALKNNIDFNIIWYDFAYDVMYVPFIEKMKTMMAEGKLSEEEEVGFRRFMRESTNIAVETLIKMVAVKNETTN